jgi:hypothetical protein
MSGKLISVVAVFSVLSSFAVALIVTRSDFSASVRLRAYPTRADFDWILGQFGTDSTFDPESMAADREKIAGRAGLVAAGLTANAAASCLASFESSHSCRGD